MTVPPVIAVDLDASASSWDTSAQGVVVDRVWRYFGDFPALAGISFTAPYGQVTALVGPNGAGKPNPRIWHSIPAVALACQAHEPLRCAV